MDVVNLVMKLFFLFLVTLLYLLLFRAQKDRVLLKDSQLDELDQKLAEKVRET